MVKEIKALKRDLRINNNFVNRLIDAGVDVRYGVYSYWSNQEYVQIGACRVWLVTEWRENGSCGVQFKMRNTFISQVYETIREQIEVIAKLEKQEKDFWAKLDGQISSEQKQKGEC